MLGEPDKTWKYDVWGDLGWRKPICELQIDVSRWYRVSHHLQWFWARQARPVQELPFKPLSYRKSLVEESEQEIQEGIHSWVQRVLRNSQIAYAACGRSHWSFFLLACGGSMWCYAGSTLAHLDHTISWQCRCLPSCMLRRNMCFSYFLWRSPLAHILFMLPFCFLNVWSIGLVMITTRGDHNVRIALPPSDASAVHEGLNESKMGHLYHMSEILGGYSRSPSH